MMHLTDARPGEKPGPTSSRRVVTQLVCLTVDETHTRADLQGTLEAISHNVRTFQTSAIPGMRKLPFREVVVVIITEPNAKLGADVLHFLVSLPPARARERSSALGLLGG